MVIAYQRASHQLLFFSFLFCSDECACDRVSVCAIAHCSKCARSGCLSDSPFKAFNTDYSQNTLCFSHSRRTHIFVCSVFYIYYMYIAHTPAHAMHAVVFVRKQSPQRLHFCSMEKWSCCTAANAAIYAPAAKSQSPQSTEMKRETRTAAAAAAMATIHNEHVTKRFQVVSERMRTATHRA